ncbi:MAG: hypothetical protein ACRD1T_09375 [Acidimicrobiia bacterium]
MTKRSDKSPGQHGGHMRVGKKRSGEGWGPARNYSWRPFTGPDGDNPGWLQDLRHGAESSRIIDPLANELVELVVADAPELAHPRFRFSLGAWARSEARAAILNLYLEKVGFLGEGGEPRTLLNAVRAEERRAAEERRQLGLDPQSYLRMQREFAEVAKARVDLEKLQIEGRKALESRKGSGGRGD